MTREDIVRIAKEAGMESFNICIELDDFAKLVAEHEREACAKLCDEWQYMDGERLSIKIRARGQE